MPSTYNHEMEELTISCLLKSPDAYAEVQDILSPESYAWPPLRYIYDAIMSAVGKDLYPNVPTIINELEMSGKLDSISLMSVPEKKGRAVIEHLRSMDSDAERIEDYAYQVQALYAGRRIVSMASAAIDAIQSGSRPEEVLTGMDLESGHIAVNIGSKTGAIKTGADVSAQNLEDLKDVQSGKEKFIPTGMRAWDSFMNGVSPGRLYVVSAFSGDGKSALGTNLLNNIALGAEKRRKVLLLSLEMSAEETNNRLAQIRCGVPTLRLESGELTEAEQDAYVDTLDDIAQCGNIFYDDSATMTLALLRTKIRKAAGLGVKVVIIDQLEQVLVGLSGNGGKNDSSVLNFISYRIKEYAREFGVAIILMHQMNRTNDNAESRRSGAAAWDVNITGLSQAGEKPADAVLMIRHERDDDKKISKTFFVWVKHRHGATGVMEVRFVGKNLSFKDVDSGTADHPSWTNQLIEDYAEQEEKETVPVGTEDDTNEY